MVAVGGLRELGRAVCINMECKLLFVSVYRKLSRCKMLPGGGGRYPFWRVSQSQSRLQFRHHFSIDRTRSGAVDLPRACFEFKSMLHRPTHTTTVQARIASGLSRCTDQRTSRFGLAYLLTFIFSITHSQWPSFASMRCRSLLRQNLLRRCLFG